MSYEFNCFDPNKQTNYERYLHLRKIPKLNSYLPYQAQIVRKIIPTIILKLRVKVVKEMDKVKKRQSWQK